MLRRTDTNKICSFDDGTPKVEYLKTYNPENNNGRKEVSKAFKTKIS
ncbi:hypothetical protein [Flavobacterium sp. LB1P62]